jgi:hypothetical protein
LRLDLVQRYKIWIQTLTGPPASDAVRFENKTTCQVPDLTGLMQSYSNKS